MNKKIKDLTLGEIKEICRKYADCEVCPFGNHLQLCPATIYDEDLEQEIEVEDYGATN